MARNTERDAIYTIGIPRNSDTFRQLQADSEETGVSMAKLIGLRVSDWYKLRQPPLLATATPDLETAQAKSIASLNGEQ